MARLRVRFGSVVATVATLLVAVRFASMFAASSAAAEEKVYLHQDWRLASSCDAKSTGEQVSAVGFDVSKWHRTNLPNTAVGALVDDGTYKDPMMGTNLKSLPGMDYSTKHFFAIQDMPKDSPFVCSWWWRTEFVAPADFAGKVQWLHLLGINYRANVWVNGKKIADSKDVVGTFVTFEFDVTKYLQPGKGNAIALEIFAPLRNDLGITWVDWNPTPADKDMGIWKEVFLTADNGVSVRNPYVTSKLENDYKAATLTVSADLRNTTDKPVDGVLAAEIEGGIHIKQDVKLAAGETKDKLLLRGGQIFGRS